ncbi:ABC transporter substrate-binding protein [Zavarzinia sp. CC-PAN008]|uniref:ABC transporter substrate-binding protein n=1 Tax=Zavarzinia sp. CC-PAN008 TaxID=3243332 RepID=UPI003F7429A3
MRSFVLAAGLATLLSSVGFGATAWAAAPESQEPIKIGVHDWTGQRITATIAGTMLEKLGYKVEYVPIDYLTALTAMETGDITFVSEQWDTTAAEVMAKADASGKTERLGALGPQAQEDWWYPIYMKEKCPGLPNWEALKACGEAFSTPETAPKGRYLGMPATWGGHDAERIDALGLPFVEVDAGTEAAMYAELKSAIERKAPIMVWVYSPHWVSATFEGEWVQFPKMEQACYDDPAWGLNPEKTYDCGKPLGQIWKYGYVGLKTTWPTAHALLAAYQVDGPELNKMVAAVDLDGKPVEDVVAEWLGKHEADWKAKAGL